MKRLVIMTLTWDAEDKLTKLKESLMPALDVLKNLKVEWHIKDNASKDKTVEKAKTWGDNVIVYAYKDNLQNFAEGMNYIFDKAKPSDDDYVLLLNNDVVFNDTTSLKNMINIMDKDDSVGVVGARLLFNNTDLIQHCGVVFDDKYKFPTHFRSKEKSNESDKKNRLFQIVTGAVLLTKGKYYRNVCTDNASGINGLTETFRWAFDDCDMCLNINYVQNKKIVYCGETNIFHEESASLKKNPVNKLHLKGNLEKLVSKWGSIYKIDKSLYTKNKNLNLYEYKK